MLQENLDLIINKAKKICKDSEKVEAKNNEIQEKIHHIVLSNIEQESKNKEIIFDNYEEYCEYINI